MPGCLCSRHPLHAGPVKLLTNPISAGYTQNPISVYFCYTPEMQLQRCIAEVTNTPWGERVTFAFDPDGAAVPKALHVSPMMDMQNTWCVLPCSHIKIRTCCRYLTTAKTIALIAHDARKPACGMPGLSCVLNRTGLAGSQCVKCAPSHQRSCAGTCGRMIPCKEAHASCKSTRLIQTMANTSMQVSL